MVTHTHPVDGNLPKTLVARQQPTTYNVVQYFVHVVAYSPLSIYILLLSGKGTFHILRVHAQIMKTYMCGLKLDTGVSS